MTDVIFHTEVDLLLGFIDLSRFFPCFTQNNMKQGPFLTFEPPKAPLETPLVTKTKNEPNKKHKKQNQS